ncbi:MAG: NifB/NifX family molybdenum-iron cluster-binding protein [Ignavibacteriaceae bacterium]
MLIAVSVKKPDLGSELSDAFGRSEYFLLFDSTKNIPEFIQNPYSSELGGAGIQSARFLIERKVEAVITTFIGFNTLRFFNSLDIKIYKCNDCNAEDSLKLFSKGSLKEINESRIEKYPQRRRKRFGKNILYDTSQNKQNNKRT